MDVIPCPTFDSVSDGGGSPNQGEAVSVGKYVVNSSFSLHSRSYSPRYLAIATGGIKSSKADASPRSSKSSKADASDRGDDDATMEEDVNHDSNDRDGMEIENNSPRWSDQDQSFNAMPLPPPTKLISSGAVSLRGTYAVSDTTSTRVQCITIAGQWAMSLDTLANPLGERNPFVYTMQGSIDSSDPEIPQSGTYIGSFLINMRNQVEIISGTK